MAAILVRGDELIAHTQMVTRVRSCSGVYRTWLACEFIGGIWTLWNSVTKIPLGVTTTTIVARDLIRPGTTCCKGSSKTYIYIWSIYCTHLCYSNKKSQRQLSVNRYDVHAWAFCQIHKIADCACAGNAGNVFPAIAVQRSRHASRHLRDARAVVHTGSLTGGLPWSRWRWETFPAFPAHAQPAILRFWWEAHGTIYTYQKHYVRVTLVSAWCNYCVIVPFYFMNMLCGRLIIPLSKQMVSFS